MQGNEGRCTCDRVKGLYILSLGKDRFQLYLFVEFKFEECTFGVCEVQPELSSSRVLHRLLGTF